MPSPAENDARLKRREAYFKNNTDTHQQAKPEAKPEAKTGPKPESEAVNTEAVEPRTVQQAAAETLGTNSQADAQTDETQPTDATPPVDLVGVGELLNVPGHVRRDCSKVIDLMKAGVFTEEQVGLMFRRIGSIIAKGSDRESISAMKVLLSYAKAEKEAETERSRLPPQHLHIDHEGLVAMITRLRSEGKIRN